MYVRCAFSLLQANIVGDTDFVDAPCLTSYGVHVIPLFFIFLTRLVPSLKFEMFGFKRSW